MTNCKCTFSQKMVGDGCSICNPQLMIEMLREQINELRATIEAQEIIIKDKSAIMEAMAQGKPCEGCKHEKCEDHIEYRMNCGLCCRKITTPDYYEPKAQL